MLCAQSRSIFINKLRMQDFFRRYIRRQSLANILIIIHVCLNVLFLDQPMIRHLKKNFTLDDLLPLVHRLVRPLYPRFASFLVLSLVPLLVLLRLLPILLLSLISSLILFAVLCRFSSYFSCRLSYHNLRLMIFIFIFVSFRLTYVVRWDV